MAVVKKISELTPKGANLANNDLLIVGVSNGTDYDLKSVTGAELLSTAVSQTITNGVTTTAPSQNAVYDALQNKVDKVAGSRLITSAEGTILSNTSGTNTGDETATTIKSKLGITTLSGSNTGDQDLSSYAQTSQVVTLTGNQTVGGVKTFTNNTTHDSGLKIKHGSSVTSTGYTGIGANVDSLIIGVVGASQTLQFPNTNNFNYTFPASNGTLATTNDLSTKVDANSAITGATKTKITYDSKGLVTAGADATTADIADSLNKRYVTDANLTTLSNTSGTNTGDQIISDATLTTSDITTNNVSTTKHGFVPKAPNNTTQFLRGDGTWATPSAGGLTYFSEAQNTSAPNATVPVDSLTAVSATTNADLALLPKGTGAFIVGHIPDGTATGGSKRGTGAIEIQLGTLDSSGSVASGANSILIGSKNYAVGANAIAIGAGAVAVGANAIALGSGNNVRADGINSLSIGNNGNNSSSSGNYSIALVGGQSSGVGSFAVGYSTASGTNSIAMGGVAYDNANATGYCSFAVGQATLANGANSVALGYSSSTKGIASRLSLASYISFGTYVIGNSQLSLSSSVANTTTNSVVELTSTGGTSICLPLQNNEAIRVKGSIIGKQAGSTNIACYDFDCVIVRGTTAASTILPLNNLNLVLDTITLDTIPTLTANTTLGGLSVKSGAKTTTTIKWSCRIDSTEVILA